MDTILVPYDGSAGAKRALRYATEAHPEREIVVLYVVEFGSGASGMPDVAAEYYRGLLDNARELVDRAIEPHDNIVGEVSTGRPVHTILAYADDHDVEHIVMGNRGRDGTARVLLGSVAEAVVRRSPVPTTVVRSDSTSRPDRVLVAFDGSSEANAALEFALETYDCEITVLFVVHPSQTLTERLFRRTEESVGDWEDERKERTDEVLGRAEAVATEHDRSIDATFLEGEPATEILEFLEDSEFDHVVVGSRGRGGVERLLFGSTAERVVRRAPVSVTVVR